MTSPFSEVEEALNAARAELSAAIARTQEELVRYRAQNQPTPEEQRALQEAALRGELGPDLRELAEHVARGDDTWDAIFVGESPHVDLLRGHLDRMIAATGPAIAQAFEEDEEFDPSVPPPDL
jgi:hypothetical protein